MYMTYYLIPYILSNTLLN
uniref:Uncharacterized protein n=1 Tax=Anguilla anguilla TaxID=7936 RepID=A0A0E9VIK0_ANGAN